ncbi:MAG: hypothetical protein COY11_05710, partial [Candidatus Portnoybacteria bacterium CG_4_10_14_0_2_um_filter_44_20]
MELYEKSEAGKKESLEKIKITEDLIRNIAKVCPHAQYLVDILIEYDGDFFSKNSDFELSSETFGAFNNTINPYCFDDSQLESYEYDTELFEEYNDFSTSFLEPTDYKKRLQFNKDANERYLSQFRDKIEELEEKRNKRKEEIERKFSEEEYPEFMRIKRLRNHGTFKGHYMYDDMERETMQLFDQKNKKLQEIDEWYRDEYKKIVPPDPSLEERPTEDQILSESMVDAFQYWSKQAEKSRYLDEPLPPSLSAKLPPEADRQNRKIFPPFF